MSFTATQIQNFREIMETRIRQKNNNFDLIKSKTDEVWGDTEIVAFLQSKNIQKSEMDSFILTFIMKVQGKLDAI